MRVAFALVVVLAAAVAACGGSERASDATSVSPARPSLLAYVWSRNPHLARLDAVTLRRRGPAVDVRMETPSASARSPGGARLVVGSGDGVRLTFVDVRQMRRLKTLDLGAKGYVAGVAWPSPRRVVAALSGIEVEIVVVDPLAARVVRRHELAGTVMRAVRSPDGLVLLLAAPDGIGRARLAVATPTSVRTASLPVEAGADPPSAFEPGLAVAPGGRRALVTAGGSVAYEVDLETLQTAERELSQRVSLLGRLRDWLEPTASAKGPLDGPVRSATWMAGGGIVVAGWDHRRTGERTSVAEAAGVRLIDPATWSVRTLAESGSSAVVAGDTILVFGGTYGPSGPRGIGLRAFDRNGNERFHVFGDRGVGSVSAAGRYAYVSEQDQSKMQIELVDLRSGRVLPTVRRATYMDILQLG
jgi:hypothetical protein